MISNVNARTPTVLPQHGITGNVATRVPPNQQLDLTKPCRHGPRICPAWNFSVPEPQSDVGGPAGTAPSRQPPSGAVTPLARPALPGRCVSSSRQGGGRQGQPASVAPRPSRRLPTGTLQVNCKAVGRHENALAMGHVSGPQGCRRADVGRLCRRIAPTPIHFKRECSLELW